VKALYFIILNQGLEKVFATEEGVGFSLPTYTTRVNVNVGFESPNPFNEWFEERFGLKVFRRYAIDSLHIDDVYFIVEASQANSKFEGLTGGQWVHFDALPPLQREVVSSVARHYNQSYGMPWIDAKGFHPYLNWALDLLQSEGTASVMEIEQIKNAYVSSVFRLITNRGDYYLKVIGSEFIREGAITRDLLRWGFLPTVEVVAFFKDGEAYLMRDMGGHNLEDAFDPRHLKEALLQTAHFQKQVLKHVNPCDLSGYYDLTIPTLKQHLDNAVDDARLLLANTHYQLTSEEEELIAGNLEHYTGICAAVGDLVPNSLDHGDLRPGNIRICDEDRLLIYDWAWTSYTHPFFMVNNFLSIIRRNEAVIKMKPALVDAYMTEWTEFAPIEKLRQVYSQIEKLTYVYHTTIDAYWLRAVATHYPDNQCDPYSADGWLLDRRQYYYADVVRKLTRIT